jgi:hypothetical protein
LGVGLGGDEVQRFAHPLVAQDGRAAGQGLARAPEAREDEQDLEHVRLVHEREAEAAPAGLGVAGEVVAAPVDVVAQEELGAGAEGGVHRWRAALGRDLRERLERLDRAHAAGVAAPAHLEPVVGPAGGRVALGVRTDRANSVRLDV